MKLEDFIADTLIGIKNGLKKANAELGDEYFVIQDPYDNRKINFDVALTVSEKTDKSGGAKVKVLSVLDAGLNGKTDSFAEFANRVKFTVIYLS